MSNNSSLMQRIARLEALVSRQRTISNTLLRKIQVLERGAAVIPVWAEENAPLNPGSYEWAFGNGANCPNNQGVVMYQNAQLIAFSASLAAGSASIAVEHGGTTVFTATNVTGSYYETLANPVAISAGQSINFRTVTQTGTGTPNIVTAWYQLV